MKNKKPRFCLIRQTIFPSDVLISVSTQEQLFAWVKKHRKYHLSDEEKEKLCMNGVGRCVMLECGAVIIRLQPEKTKIGIDIANLTHEISHAVSFILSRIDTPHSDDTHEVYAYLMGHLMREALNYFDK